MQIDHFENRLIEKRHLISLRAINLFLLIAIFFFASCASTPVGQRRPATERAVFTPQHARNTLPDINNEHVLLVVHATEAYDSDSYAAAGINTVIAQFKQTHHAVYYLIDDQTEKGYAKWYTRDRSPDYEVFSEGGEHNIPMNFDEVTIVGGFFGSYDMHRGCQTLAARDAIRMHFEVSSKPFTVHMPLRAIYHYDADDLNFAEILAVNDKTSERDFRKAFKDFPEIFFLVDDGAGENWEFGHEYFGKHHPSYRPGKAVDLEHYTFQVYYNNKPTNPSFGTGPHHVAIKLENY